MTPERLREIAEEIQRPLISRYTKTLVAELRAHADELERRIGTALASAAEDERKLRVEIDAWRQLAFTNHACIGKYGDDGEMQCNKCFIDFKRQSPEEISERLYINGVAWMNQEQTELKGMQADLNLTKTMLAVKDQTLVQSGEFILALGYTGPLGNDAGKAWLDGIEKRLVAWEQILEPGFAGNSNPLTATFDAEADMWVGSWFGVSSQADTREDAVVATIDALVLHTEARAHLAEKRLAANSRTWGELPHSIQDILKEPHEWDNKNPSEQRDWAIERLAEAEAIRGPAGALVEAMETCHACKSSVLVEEGPTYCSEGGCSYDCDDHDPPNCVGIDVLHARLKAALGAAPPTDGEREKGRG